MRNAYRILVKNFLKMGTQKTENRWEDINIGRNT